MLDVTRLRGHRALSVVVAVLMIAAVPWMFTRAEDPQVTTDTNNAVMLDAGNSEMYVPWGYYVNGTVAHVVVFNAGQLTGPLVIISPNNVNIQTQGINSEGLAVFQHVDLATNGTWVIETALGTHVTQFDVNVYDGATKPAADPSLVTLFPTGENHSPLVTEMGDLFNLGDPPTLYQTTQGNVIAWSSNNTVDATVIPENISMAENYALHLLGTYGIDSDFVAGDSSARFMMVNQTNIVEQGVEKLPACASVSFGTYATGWFNPFCLHVVHEEDKYEVDLHINAVFENGVFPLFAGDSDIGWFYTS